MKISLRFPQNPTTHIFFIFKQTLIIYVRHTYSVWISPTNWGCKLQVHVQCSWNAKMKNGELFDFLPSVRNSFHAFWINDLLASVNGSTFFCVYLILLIHIVDFGTWKYLHYSMLRVKMIPDTRMHHQDYMRVLSRVF